MSNDRVKILGINLSNLTSNEVLESIEKYLTNDQLPMANDQLKTIKPLVIFTPNPEIVVYSQKDEKFKEIVNTAQINLPDGAGLIWASKILGTPLKERIQGADLMENLVELAAKKSLTVGLIGGKRGVALKALERLRQKYPGLQGWAEEGPQLEMRSEKWENGNRNGKSEVGISPQNISLQYPASHIPPLTSILFVGLGCPKQEYFINNFCHPEASAEGSPANAGLMNPLVLMAVGGSFDYLSGRVKRAPLFMRLMGFEWLFRLVFQPWRWKRQLALIKFIWLVVLRRVLVKDSPLLKI